MVAGNTVHGSELRVPKGVCVDTILEYEEKIKKPLTQWGSLDIAGYFEYCGRN